MKWLIDLLGGKAVDNIGGVIDSLSTSNEEKSKVKNELSQIVLNSLNELANAQKDVLIAELQGSPIQRMWRPIVMLTFAFIIVFHYFGYPLAMAFDPTVPELPILDSKFWTLLEIGMGGYVVGRSLEKISENVTKNVDFSFMKKKNRKED